MQNIVILSSMEFLFRFLPVFLIVYYLVPARWRDAVMFLGSILFYAAGAPVFVVLLLGMTVLNYFCGVLLFYDRATHRPVRERRGTLAFAVIADAGVLVLFKVLALAVDSSLLPLGISFYIFKMISYQADLYRGTIPGPVSFIRTAAYFIMFPQVTQGPIMRYQEGFGRPHAALSPERFEEGLTYVVMGLGMKVLLADRLAILWNEVYKIGYDGMSTPLAWLGAYGYSFRLYYDFWGYSLIAAGIGVMLGFPFIENFIHPYAAANIGDFYRRWHATLGSWFKDYIYIPLGGSRRGTGRTIRNLLIVWLCTGLWHGGTWNFVIWGLVLGAVIIFEKFVLGKGTVGKITGRFNVLVIIPLTWVVFAVTDLPQLGMYFARLFPFFGLGQTVNPSDFTRELSMFAPYLGASVVLLFPQVYQWLVRHRRNPFVILLLAAVFWYSMYYLANSSGNTFMYLNF